LYRIVQYIHIYPDVNLNMNGGLNMCWLLLRYTPTDYLRQVNVVTLLKTTSVTNITVW